MEIRIEMDAGNRVGWSRPERSGLLKNTWRVPLESKETVLNGMFLICVIVRGKFCWNFECICSLYHDLYKSYISIILAAFNI